MLFDAGREALGTKSLQTIIDAILAGKRGGSHDADARASNHGSKFQKGCGFDGRSHPGWTSVEGSNQASPRAISVAGPVSESSDFGLDQQTVCGPPGAITRSGETQPPTVSAAVAEAELPGAG